MRCHYMISGTICSSPPQVIPRQLCDNAGFDATNILNKLRQKHAQVELFISLINKLAV